MKSPALLKSLYLLFIFTFSPLFANSDDALVLKKGHIVCDSTESALFLANILENKLEKRTGIKYAVKHGVELQNRDAKDQLVLCIHNSTYALNIAEKYEKKELFQQQHKAEGFKIIFCSNEDNVVIIQGTDERGLLYGIGRFLHSIQQREKNYIIRTKDVIDYPKSEIRVAWLATNMNNSLSTLSMASYEDLLLEYALWGANYVMTFYGPHFGDPLDPGTPDYERELWLKLPTIFNLAHKYFYSTIYHIHHNYIFPGEGRWAKGPIDNYQSIAAQDFGGGIADHRVCLSKQGMELVFQKYGWILTELKDQVDVINVHCLDPGGCGCDQCKPFAKTYYHVAKKYEELWKKIKPNGEVWVDQWWLAENPWYPFQKGSTEASIFVQELQKEMPDWLTATMFDDMSVSKDIPDRYKKVGMMYTCQYPYGALGYQDNAYSSLSEKYSQYLENDIRDGMMIYTEGIQNNLALILNLQFSWFQTTSVLQNVIQDYAGYYLGDKNLDQKTRYIIQLNKMISEGYYSYLRNGEIEKLYNRDFFNAFINDIQRISALGDSVQQEYLQAPFNWRWALLYHTGQLWNDIGQLAKIQLELQRFQNVNSASQFEKQSLLQRWQDAHARFYSDLKIIRTEIYEMPESLVSRAFVHEILDENFAILKVVLDKNNLQSFLEGVPE